MSPQYRFSDDELRFQGEVRAFFARELPADHWRLQNDRDDESPEREAFNRDFLRRLAARGWLTLHWPVEYGGGGAGQMRQLIYNEEAGYAHAPTDRIGLGMAGPTLMQHGTEAQKQRHLPAIAAAEEIWCQGFSEPDAGSDLASLQTRAVRDGDDYVVNGEKIWTSFGHTADWCELLVRTDPAAPKHKGISFLLLDMTSPGVTVRPLVNMLGSHTFNAIHLEDVRVPRANLVGEENRGWYVATTTLDFERSGIGRIAWGRRMLEALVDYARGAGIGTDSGPGGGNARVSAAHRGELAELWLSAEIARLLAYRVAWLQSQGRTPNYEASMSKLFISEVVTAITRAGANMLGPAGLLRRGSAGCPALFGAMPEAYMAGTSFSVAGGTSEIQRNIIATRGLGLPRG